MRKLRRFYGDAELLGVYAHRYDSSKWDEHTRRIAFTSRLMQDMINENGLTSLADLSCGDGSMTAKLTGIESRHLRDITDAGDDILSLLAALTTPVDLFVCTETIEHLEAPWTLLERVAPKCKWLVLSCPNDEQGDANWEHYWSFTQDDVCDMLTQAGFTEPKHIGLWEPGWNYDYQIWTARGSV